MSQQVEPGTFGSAAARAGSRGQIAFVPQTPGTPVAYPRPFHGRAVSWFSVTLVMVGFLVGGLALVFGPTWVVFWAGVGLAVVGGLIALATNIFDDWY